MADSQITSLHEGMNLRDPAPIMQPGEVGLAVGCDFSVPGQVTPMRAGLLDQAMAADIQDAHEVYIGETKYRFTTHADGLRVTYLSLNQSTTLLLDSLFTGVFCALPVNDTYVVLASTTRNRKWIPGATSTIQWGLNTPPLPTLSAVTPTTKTIDTFESLGAWAFTGGGAGAALAADLVNFKAGTQSMKLTCDALQTIIAKKTVALDLSYFTVSGDAGKTPMIGLSLFPYDLTTINRIKIKMSCAVGGGYDKDYYQAVLQFGGDDTADLAVVQKGGLSIITGDGPEVVSPGLQIIDENYKEQEDIEAQTLRFKDAFDKWKTQVIKNNQMFQNLTPLQAQILSVSTLSWADLTLAQSDFFRVGSTAGRDWSTITNICIEVTATGSQAQISFDSWFLTGGGNLTGAFYLAVAYQNAQANYGPFTAFAGPVELKSQQLLVSGLTPDTDAQTTKRRFAIFSSNNNNPMVAYLENNTATSYQLNDDMDDLVEVETNFNNSPPPVGIKSMAELQGRIFLVTGDENLYYSNPLFYEAFPATNFQITAGGEQNLQIVVVDQNYLAVRGPAREFLVQLTGDSPLYWQMVRGARVGAVSSRLSIEDLSGGMVFVSPLGLYISGAGGRGEYLPKINPAIATPANVFGAQGTSQAYLYFQDTDGVDRVLRIDYKLGRPTPHYVANIAPTAIWADPVTGAVYYALGANIYQFDAGSTPLPTLLTIPDQLAGTNKRKDFVSLDYELSGGALTFTVTIDGVAQAASYTLPVAAEVSDPASLPQGTTGRRVGLVLSSTTEDFIVKLPWAFEVIPVD